MTRGWQKRPTAPLSSLVDELGYEFQGLPLDALEAYARRAAQTACRMADLDVWAQKIHTQHGVKNYLLEPAEGTDIVALLGVRCLSGADLHRQIRRVTEKPQRGFPGVAVWHEPRVRELWFEGLATSGEPSVFEAEVSLCPLPDACEVSAEFAGRLYEPLMDGVKSYVYDMAGRPLFSPQLAQSCRAKFLDACRQAKIEDMSGRQRGMLRLTYPRMI